MNRSSQSRRRRRSPLLPVALVLLACVLGWTLFARATGRDVVPASVLGVFGGSVEASEPEDEGRAAPAEGMVRVPVSARPMGAYGRVTRDDLWNPNLGEFTTTDIREETARERGIFTSMGQIFGRVLAEDKQPGYVFSESDFLPEGTRPGMVAGIPPGMRAMRVEVETVAGIVGLQPGDRFDVVASLSLGAPRGEIPAMKGIYAALASRGGALPGSKPRNDTRVVVQNGIVVSPVTIRQVPSTSTTLTQGTRVRTLPKQEMVIAVSPEEVAPLMEAIAQGAEITCLARSGHPDDPVDSLTPSGKQSSVLGAGLGGLLGEGGDQEFTLVETFSGSSRGVVPVPKQGNR